MNKIASHTKQNLTLAYENHKKGNLKLAESIYKKILKVDKDNFKVFFLLGTLMLQKKNFPEGKNQFSPILGGSKITVLGIRVIHARCSPPFDQIFKRERASVGFFSLEIKKNKTQK